MARKKRTINAEDLYSFEIIIGCEMAPDGKHIAFAVQRVDKNSEKKYSNIWIVPSRGGRPKQFTYGDWNDYTPKWSPDGSQIAFLSNRKDEQQAQLYLIPFDGGEARPLTDLNGVFGSFEWSPDGTNLVCEFTKKDQEELEREADEQKKKLGIVARHITRVFYKMDGIGFLPQERKHLWTIDAKTGKAAQLTDSEVFDEWEPHWSPDGAEILFFSNRTKDPDLDPEVIDLYLIPAQGGELRKIDVPVGEKFGASFSPDGKWIAYIGYEGRGQAWRQKGVWIVPADGSAPARNLTITYDFNVAGWTINDLNAIPPTPPTWIQDGSQLLFHVAQHGNTLLKAMTVNDDEPVVTDMVDDDGVVGKYGFDTEQNYLAFFHADLQSFGQIWVKNMKTGSLRKVTHVNEPLLRNIDLGDVEEVWFKSPDGNDVQGWILTPPGFDASQKYPSILEIHGGPTVQYGNLFMHEFYYLAAQGYVVLFCNPRGSDGYGEAHAKAIDNDWGGADYADLMAWTDYVSQQPYIDPERMGVTGGSYGGYMTNWIIGHTNRFKAAVTQRSVSNTISFWGSSDFNWYFQMEFGKKPPWEDDGSMQNYWRQSPMKYIKNAKTPTLVMHSENDLRCDMEQGEQVYIALKVLGVDTEFVRFPDEPHGLSRGGRTDRRIVRLNHIVRWFDKYLKA